MNSDLMNAACHLKSLYIPRGDKLQYISKNAMRGLC